MNETRPPWEQPPPGTMLATPRRDRRRAIYETEWFAELAITAGLGAVFALPTWAVIAVNEARQFADLLGQFTPSCSLGLMCGGIVFMAVALVVVVYRRAIWAIEGATGKDWGPGGPESRKEPDRDWTLALVNDGQFPDMPRLQYLRSCGIDCQRMVELAQMVVSGVALSHNSVTGKGRPLSRDELTMLQEQLVELGHARWKSAKSKNQGVELTPPGRAMFRAIATGKKA